MSAIGTARQQSVQLVMLSRSSCRLTSIKRLWSQTCKKEITNSRPFTSSLAIARPSEPHRSDNNKHGQSQLQDFLPQPGSNSNASAVLAAFILFAGGVKVGFDLKDYFNYGKGTSVTSDASPVYADHEGMIQALAELRNVLAKSVLEGDLEIMISTEQEIIQQHAHSEWSTSNSTNRPVAVIYPRNTEDVSTIAKICTKHRVPMVPYGAGSSVEGQFSAPHSGFTIDFSRMDKVMAVHEDDMDVVVQPGVNWVTLNKQLAPAGLFLPLDPSPTALIGGMINTNCSGTNAMRYGTMKDWVINVTVVLPDGKVLKTRRRPRKSSAGYDLTRLFVGSEGTLGFVTEATLKLAVVPKSTGVATCSFADVKTASTAAVKMIREGIVGLAALELMDQAQMRVINKNGGTLTSDGKTRRLWNEEPTLFMKFSGTEKTITDDVQRVKAVATRYGGSKLEHASGEKEKDAIWAARKEALFAMVAQRDEGTEIWSTDVAVPLSRLAEIIDVSQQESSKLGLFNTVMGHVGDGNFHQSVCYHPGDPEETAAVSKCVHDMMDRALALEGTVSGEHAIGIGKKPELEKEAGVETMNLMRLIKRSIDPYHIMNPGKVFDYRSSSKS